MSTELVVVNAQNAVEIFTKGGLDAILAGIETQVRSMTLDGSTANGREQIRSVAYKVARTKTALDSEAKKLTEDWRKNTSLVNTERKRAQERLEALADEVRAPLTAFENKEKARIAAHEEALAEMAGLLEMLRAHPNMTAELLKDHERDFAGMNAARDWEEFVYRAQVQRAEVSAYLAERITARVKFDADQAELERLRKEDAERKARERDEKLKAEAAETARLATERKAKQEADAEARRVIEAANTEKARVTAEADRIRAEHEREQKEAESARKREQDAREEAERKAARATEDLKAAKEKAKRDADAAVAKERERVERQNKLDHDARVKREEDEKNVAMVRREIAEDIALASDIVSAIVDGRVRHVRVVW